MDGGLGVSEGRELRLKVGWLALDQAVDRVERAEPSGNVDL